VDNDPIFNDQHIARYCSQRRLDSYNKPMYLAFQLRPNEQYLSVNWLEYFDLMLRNQQISALRQVFLDKGRGLGAMARFAVLNVGEMRNHVLQGTAGRTCLTVLHKPEIKDQSHCGIFGSTYGDDEGIAALIVEKVLETHPARE
jgi:hypothetical protein